MNVAHLQNNSDSRIETHTGGARINSLNDVGVLMILGSQEKTELGNQRNASLVMNYFF